MRLLITFSWDIEKANTLAKQGTLGKTAEEILPRCLNG